MARSVGRAEREQRRRLVVRWQGSGESAPEFAKRHGVSSWQLYAWAKQTGGRGPAERQRGVASRREHGGPSEGPGIDILPVRLVADRVSTPVPAAAVVEVQLRGGEVVRVVGEVPMERVRAVVTAVLAAC